MSISQKLKESLIDHDTHDRMTQIIELTPELKKRLERISLELIDDMVKRTRSPFEAYMVLHFMMDAMQDAFGIRGAVITTEGGQT